MVDNKREPLSKDDFYLLMQGYKNTVELSSSVLIKLDDMVDCVKDIVVKLDSTKDIVYDTSKQVIDKVDVTENKIYNKVEKVATTDDISNAKEKIGELADRNKSAFFKLHLVLSGIIGTLITIIGSLLYYMHVAISGHNEKVDKIFSLLTQLAQKSGIIIK